jgi:hypothetical protein
MVICAIFYIFKKKPLVRIGCFDRLQIRSCILETKRIWAVYEGINNKVSTHWVSQEKTKCKASFHTWLDHIAREQLEVVHRAFLKSLLGVNTTTSSYVVLAEFGRFPLAIFWWQ